MSKVYFKDRFVFLLSFSPWIRISISVSRLSYMFCIFVSNKIRMSLKNKGNVSELEWCVKFLPPICDRGFTDHSNDKVPFSKWKMGTLYK